MNKTKIYKSYSEISINIILKGGNKHIAFVPSSDGTSTYITKDREEQAAIEKHYNFNKLFRLQTVIEPVKPTQAQKPTQEEKVKGIEVPDIAAAKDYLVDKFGISRTALRTQTSIIEQAEQHNIIIKNI